MEDSNRKIRKDFIFIGLGLQVFALIFAYLCLTLIPYIGWLPALYLSPFIFIAGIIFVFFSKIKLVYKFVLGFWIILIPIGFIGERYYQKQFIQNEIYLIPKNYHGEVSVNFGESDGIVPNTENNAVVLKINSNGTLKTTYVAKRLRYDLEQETENYREYYLVDETGNRTKLQFKRGLPQPISETNEVLVVPFGYYFSSDGKTVDKIEFFVGTAAELSETLKKK